MKLLSALTLLLSLAWLPSCGNEASSSTASIERYLEDIQPGTQVRFKDGLPIRAEGRKGTLACGSKVFGEIYLEDVVPASYSPKMTQFISDKLFLTVESIRDRNARNGSYLNKELLLKFPDGKRVLKVWFQTLTFAKLKIDDIDECIEFKLADAPY
jgi:hypothetical protein